MLRIIAKVVVLVATLAAVSCGSRLSSVALSDVCNHPDNGSDVRVEGYFRLPQASDRDGDISGSGEYRLLLVEKLNGGGSFIKATIAATGVHEPNRIDTLPLSYTYDDLRINTSSGKTVSADEKLTIVGKVSNDTKPCILRVKKIETSQS